MPLESRNPATGELIARYDVMSPGQVNDIVQAVHATFPNWAALSFAERAACFRNAAKLLRANKHSYGTLMTQEMGKPISDAEGEAEKCAWVCEYYAEYAGKFLAPEEIKTDATKSYVTYQPLGVILALMPWNFPFWQVFRCAAPAMMAGNTMVLKHAKNVTQCALAIEELFEDAGFPGNAFCTLLIEVPAIESVIRNAHVAAVSLTGSTAAGRAVGSQAGSAVKRCVLELGGSDPFIVLEDADLDAAAETGATSRLFSSGQSCIAAKRFIVVESVREPFETRLIEILKQKKVGDPMSEDTDVGPQARPDLRENVHRQVTGSVEKGAKVLLGGEVPGGPGAFYPITVITGVRQGMPAYHEEVFGPVVSIIPVKDEEEAISVANDSDYGLGATVFSRDIPRAEKIAAEKLRAGSCFVNAFVRSDPRLPFGGIKESGYGRELGRHGILEFVNIKTVYIG